MKKLKILFTEGSSLSARQTLNVLGGNHIIDIMDPSPICQCRFSKFVRQYHRCPHYAKNPEQYLDFLGKLLRQESYDVLIPTHENVFLICRAQKALSQLVHFAVPPLASLERVEGKYEFIQFLKYLNFSYPDYRLIRSPEDLFIQDSFPSFVKQSYGTAGQTVWKASNFEDLKKISLKLEQQDSFADLDNKIFIQEPGKGDLSVAQAIFNSGELLACHSFQALRDGYGGMVTIRKSVHHPIVIEQIKQMGEILKWHGPLFIDYFYDETSGRVEYLEINSRIGEPYNAYLSGINIPEIYLNIALGIPYPKPETPIGKRDIRTYDGYMILASIATQGGTRRMIFKELWRILRKAGPYENSRDELTLATKDPPGLIIFIFFVLQILISPRLANLNIKRTISDYSLPFNSLKIIRAMPESRIRDCLQISRKDNIEFSHGNIESIEN